MGRTIRFIGDVHGWYGEYLRITEQVDESIQVGDMGIGFKIEPSFPKNEDNPKHRFIRGNHDNPELCKKNSRFILDGTYEEETGMFFLGGGLSIDQKYRTEGVSWWRGEELTIREYGEILDHVLEVKPRIMVTHECPQSVSRLLHSHHSDITSRTSQFLDTLFSQHQPQIWVFGHHHMNFTIYIDGTEFVCLDELYYTDIDIE